MNVIKLGSQVKDIVTGLTGIATSRTEYLNGCIRYGVDPGVDKDGKSREAQWVDVQQLVVLTEDTEVVRHMAPPQLALTGGPAPAPRDRQDAPSR